MKNLSFLLVFLCLISCGLEYDGSTRIEFKGRIVDETGLPLKNISLKAIAELRTDLMYGAHDSDVVSYGQTDENGEFKLFFSSPINETDLMLWINSDDSENPVNPAYSQIIYYHIEEEDTPDFRLDIGTVELIGVEDLVDLRVHFTNSNPFWIHGANYEGKMKIKYWNMSPNLEDEFLYASPLRVKPNQTIEVQYYYYTDNSELMSGIEDITIGNQDLTYEINL
jgi:hypothetical protein